MKVVSVNIGSKKIVEWNGRKVVTGIFKEPVKEAIFLGKEDVLNDVVVDRKYHGGVDQAVYAYSLKHYDYWKTLYPDIELSKGMFGENLTMSDLDETKIHSGSKYQLGAVILEVTKPREPCMKLGIRFGTQKVLKQFWNSTKSGIYFKVIQTGSVNIGDELKLISKNPSGPTIAEMYVAKRGY